ncbi:unnamed protein product [Paramecium octaurelia]|uniref:Uncharacterized protein n=1 Tax=Paramecium octaurelia TaxID=43137 RepID=A0A8S1YP31_PAROT|nr:unnamed protein product [Paramecium octaurelia]
MNEQILGKLKIMDLAPNREGMVKSIVDSFLDRKEQCDHRETQGKTQNSDWISILDTSLHLKTPDSRQNLSCSP